MSRAVDKIATMLERPARNAAITGLPVLLTLTSQDAKNIAAMLRLLDGDKITEAARIIRAALLTSGLFEIIKLWLLLRIVGRK